MFVTVAWKYVLWERTGIASPIPIRIHKTSLVLQKQTVSFWLFVLIVRFSWKYAELNEIRGIDQSSNRYSDSVSIADPVHLRNAVCGIQKLNP